jgi:hypothetical protein
VRRGAGRKPEENGNQKGREIRGEPGMTVQPIL